MGESMMEFIERIAYPLQTMTNSGQISHGLCRLSPPARNSASITPKSAAQNSYSGLAARVVAAVVLIVCSHPLGAAFNSQAGASPGAAPPVPVVAGTVAKKDVPIYLDGLGTV